MAKEKETTEGKLVAQNRKARHDFFIEETFEAGIELRGTEIKSIRAGRMNIKDGFARIEKGEVMLHNAHISPYEQGNRFNHDPLRTRRLLLHKGEIKKLAGKSQQEGYSIIPLKVYIKNGFAKVLIGLAKGKKKYDKRETLKQKTAKREMDKAVGQRMKGMR
ncbi:SsrA-binding protein [Salsuginibacillus halophilus]|uniref:SsrA-binding protein n=1 Tax=Salsuginibacillus halophilus TaxID=517424 RepID=A0A2P8H9B0_9BACI|nr:SsrA-binding protein SmpB [Salsuginibacillus halophilus]PSL42781.1 SsrA-binding protein [Salsuginibacillus halophilus]